MRILYLSQYFPPEAGATQARAYEMAKTWVKLGHRVTMLAEIPNHPSGIIPKYFRGKIYERSDLDGIDVIRVWVKTSPIKNFINRMLFYLTYMINATLAGIFLAHGKYDLIYASSPPLFVGGAALAMRAIKRIPLVFEVRDLWPESAIALGELRNLRVIAMAQKLEEACYHKALQVVVVTHNNYEHLTQRGIEKDKLFYVPNGANVEMFTFHQTGRVRIRHQLGLEQKFIAIYAGIHGLAQGLETVFDAARLLQSNPDVHFLLIGDGPKKAELLTLAETYKLPNLTMLPEKPREQIPDYLSAADVALIPLKKAKVFKGALPSKIFDAWSCEIPVLISIDGEASQVVEDAQGGIYIPPEDAEKMAEALIYLKDSPSERKKFAENGLNYTRQHHSRAALAEQLILHLEKCLKH
jgi:colanic acid biosynthesis glycosyl transferase WcaI